MDKLLPLLFAIIVPTFVFCQSDERKLRMEETNWEFVEYVTKVSDHLLEKMKNGKFEELSTKEVNHNLAVKFCPDSQRVTYNKLKARYGDYLNIKFREVIEKNNNYIYKFTAQFDDSYELVKVKTVFDSNNKLADFEIDF